MSAYIIGDIHGCYDEFSCLLQKIKFNPKEDQLFLTGDLIGRGPKPVETLETILKLKRNNPDKIHAVLGNHDLNLLSVALGYHKAKKKDNLDVILQSDILEDVKEFYFNTPLVYVDKNLKFAIAHAGVYPMWSLEEAEFHSNNIAKVLSDPLNSKLLLCNMYGDSTSFFDKDLLKQTDLPYWRFVVSAFTRMRLCNDKLELDYGHSNCTVKEASKDNIYPWFKYGKPYLYKKEAYKLFFGHWAALNAECNEKNIIALDTGCVWGNKLTCHCLNTITNVSVDSKVKVEYSNKK